MKYETPQYHISSTAIFNIELDTNKKYIRTFNE